MVYLVYLLLFHLPGEHFWFVFRLRHLFGRNSTHTDFVMKKSRSLVKHLKTADNGCHFGMFIIIQSSQSSQIWVWIPAKNWIHNWHPRQKNSWWPSAPSCKLAKTCWDAIEDRGFDVSACLVLSGCHGDAKRVQWLNLKCQQFPNRLQKETLNYQWYTSDNFICNYECSLLTIS